VKPVFLHPNYINPQGRACRLCCREADPIMLTDDGHPNNAPAVCRACVAFWAAVFNLKPAAQTKPRRAG
jgi:hypothetical protein